MSSSCHLVLLLFLSFLISSYRVPALSPHSIDTVAKHLSHIQVQILLPLTLSITEQSCSFLLCEYFLLLTLAVSQVPSIPSVWLSSWVILINCASSGCLGARVLQTSFLDHLFFPGSTVHVMMTLPHGFTYHLHVESSQMFTSLWHLYESPSPIPSFLLKNSLQILTKSLRKKFVISLPSVLITLSCFK